MSVRKAPPEEAGPPAQAPLEDGQRTVLERAPEIAPGVGVQTP